MPATERSASTRHQPGGAGGAGINWDGRRRCWPWNWRTASPGPVEGLPRPAGRARLSGVEFSSRRSPRHNRPARDPPRGRLQRCTCTSCATPRTAAQRPRRLPAGLRWLYTAVTEGGAAGPGRLLKRWRPLPPSSPTGRDAHRRTLTFSGCRQHTSTEEQTARASERGDQAAHPSCASSRTRLLSACAGAVLETHEAWLKKPLLT